MCSFILCEMHAILSFSPKNWLFSFLRSMRKIKWFLVWDKVRTDCNAKSNRMSRKLKQAKAHELKLLLFRGAGGNKKGFHQKLKTSDKLQFCLHNQPFVLFFPKTVPDFSGSISRPELTHPEASTSPSHVQYFTIRGQYTNTDLLQTQKCQKVCITDLGL